MLWHLWPNKLFFPPTCIEYHIVYRRQKLLNTTTQQINSSTHFQSHFHGILRAYHNKHNDSWRIRAQQFSMRLRWKETERNHKMSDKAVRTNRSDNIWYILLTCELIINESLCWMRRKMFWMCVAGLACNDCLSLCVCIHAIGQQCGILNAVHTK